MNYTHSNNINNNNFEELNKNFFEKLPDDISMITKVWGPPTWFFLHSMAMAYPKKINENNPEHIKIRNAMFSFLSNLGTVLPCSLCGVSYSSYIRTPELSISKFLHSRASLVHYIYLIHEKVNDKLGVPQCDRPSFKDVITFYNKFRAGPCIPTTEDERMGNLLTGCDITDIKKGNFKNYKCIVNVINKNNNKNEKINLKEKFQVNEISDNKTNPINIILLIICIVLFIITLGLFIVMKNK